MNGFITNNDEKNLKKRLIELIKKSDELKFLVGFFYFSGIQVLYEGLKENPDSALKILVGLNEHRWIFIYSQTKSRQIICHNNFGNRSSNYLFS